MCRSVEALPAAQRGAHVVLVADTVPRKRALIAAAEAAGNVAGEYPYEGTLDDVLVKAARLVPGGGGGAMTLMLVMPPPPKSLAAVRVVRGVVGL